MCAVLTPEFHASFWTDQEVGVALGRGVFVVAVRAPTVPYGFLGKVQAVPGNLSRPGPLADQILAILLARPETTEAAVSGLVVALEEADSFDHAKALCTLLEGQSVSLDGNQRPRIRTTMSENGQVAHAFGVPERLDRLLSR